MSNEKNVTSAPTRASERRLDSWKEIASHLGRGIRTVQRWEREEGLPVHRLAHAKRGSVYADRAELAKWWESRRTRLEAPPTAGGAMRALPQVERVTNTSAVTLSPALSSDARMLVYVSDGGQEDSAPQVWLQQVGGAAMRLTSGQSECTDPTFSADDTRVLFTAKGDATLNVYEITTLGGDPRLLKRRAKGGRISPDGRWLAYISLESPQGLRLESRDGGGERTIAADLTAVSFAIWSPDSRHVLVRAHPNPTFEPDYWIVPVDGGSPVNTGIIQKFRVQGTVLDSPPAWVAASVVFPGATREGVILWRQRLTAEPFRVLDDPEPLTRGTEWASSPTAAAGRMAFTSAPQDLNLWSVAVDESSGVTRGTLRRVTRGPGIMAHLSSTRDGRMMAYFSTRFGKPELFLRDLENGSDSAVTAEPANAVKGFPAISPSGRQLAHGALMPGPRAMRPLFIVDLANGISRQLCDDCGGRPRQWIDERSLLVETFGSRLNRFLIVDTTTGARRELLAGADRSATNPRISPDGGWIAFDAALPGGSPTVFIAPLGRNALISESDWILVDDAASHPFWSRDGRLLYYLPTTPNRDLRSGVRGRRIGAASKPEGDAFTAAALKETLVPTFLAGTAPIATRDQILFILGDLRGDIWMIDL